jgi:hypothetical protein
MRSARLPLALAIVITIVALAGQLADIYKLSNGVLIGLATCAAALTVILAIIDFKHRKREAPQPRLRLDVFDVTERTALHFRARRAPLVGYDEQLARLRTFVAAPERFSWWVVTGAAGSGKSRLALEFCFELRKTWNAGFLSAQQDFSDWIKWEPDKRTLIVLDYASTRGRDIASAISGLTARKAELARPVRLLLLERSVEHEWWHQVLGAGGDRIAAESTMYDQPLELEGLSRDALWTTITTVVTSRDAAPQLRRDETLDALEAIDPLGRPLFALMAADALAAGKDIREWDKHSVLQYVLERNDRLFWGPAGVTDRDKNLLAFATMLVGGIEVAALSQLQGLDPKGVFPVVDPTSADRFSADRYAVLTGQDSRTTLAPLEPDLVGEFFFLEQMHPRDAADFERALIVEMLAWLFSPGAAFEFTTRVLDDWSDHPAVPTLILLVNQDGGRMLLDAASGEQREAIAMYLAAAAGNVIHLHATAGRADAANGALEDLLGFAEAFPDLALPTIPQASAAVVVESLIRAETPDKARDVLARIGSYWEGRGREPAELEVMLRALGLRVNTATEEGDLVVAQLLLDEAIDFAGRLKADPENAGWVAESGLQLVNVAADRGVFETADEAFDSVLRLSAHGESPRLAKARGLAAFALLMSYGHREGDEDDDLLDRASRIYEVGRAAVSSKAFAEAFHRDGEEEMLQASYAVFEKLGEIFGNDKDVTP